MKLQEFRDKVIALRERSPKVFDLSVAVIVTLVVVGGCTIARAAPITGDLTNNVLTITLPSPTTPVPPTTPPASEYAACPANTTKVTNGFPFIGAGADGGVGSVATFKLTLPLTATGKHSAYFNSTYGGAANRSWAISTKACDFASPVIDSAGKKPKTLAGQFGSNAQTLEFNIADNALKAGQVYYLNLRIDSCDAGTCRFDKIVIQ